MNKFNYYITTHFITNNKDYNSYRNPHSVYQMYPEFFDRTHSEYNLESIMTAAFNIHVVFKMICAVQALALA